MPIELTGIHQNTYSSGRGIFMPESTGEVASEVRPQGPIDTAVKPISDIGKSPDLENRTLPIVDSSFPKLSNADSLQAKQEKARLAWERVDRARELSVDEKRTREMLIERGISPVEGGAPDPIIDLSTKTFTNPAFTDIVQRLVAVRSKGALDPDLIEQFKEEINGILKKEKDPKFIDEAVIIKEALVEVSPKSSMRRGEEVRREFIRNVEAILRDPTVTAELIKDDPNFSAPGPGLKNLRHLIDSLDPSGDDTLWFADYISSKDSPPPVALSETSQKILFEWVVENLISIPEKGSHEARYRLDLYTDTNLTKLKSLAFRNLGQEYSTYIGELSEIRETFHELRRNLTQGENYKKFIQEGLKSHGLDFGRNEVAGVAEAVSLFETFSALKVSQTRKWFKAGDVKEIRSQVERVMNSLYEHSAIKKNDRPLTKWEVERAVSIAETFFAGTQRRAMYAIIGEIPPGTAERIGSVQEEYVARTLAGVKVVGARFFYGGGSRQLLKRIVNRLKQAPGNPSNSTTLFGIHEDAWILNGSGAMDTESHGWRSHMMFFGDIRVSMLNPKTGDRENKTLLEYFNEKAEQFGGHFDPLLGWGEDWKSKPFADAIEDPILGQTLYLSALLKHGFWGNMDEASSTRIKTQLWQKVAILDPMGMASLNPEVLGNLTDTEMKLWKKLTDGQGAESKMGMAVAIRLRKEADRYFDDDGNRIALTDADLHAEKERLLLALEGKDDTYKYQVIDKYFSDLYGNALSDEEKNLIRKVIDTGIEKAPRLTKAALPFAFLINDAPHVAWAKTGEGEGGLADEDIFRILLSDQNNFTEGYTELNSLIEDPTHGAVEHFTNAVQKIGFVIGREPAQKRMEPYIVAYLDMARERFGTTYIGPVRNALKGVPLLRRLSFFRQGNSEMEKYWQSSGISFDEQDRAVFLESLASNGAVSNSIEKGANMSQLARLKRENWADSKANTLKFLKILLIILPPAMVYQLLKTVLPKEVFDAAGVKT